MFVFKIANDQELYHYILGLHTPKYEAQSAKIGENALIGMIFIAFS